MRRKGAIVWNDQRKIAAFVMPDDDIVRHFVTTISRGSRLPAEYEERWGNIPLAIRLFDAMRLYPLSYLTDRVTPFGTVWDTGDRIDSVQFPRETLRYGTGDCDDLVTTFASLLTSAGIDVVLYTYPGHIALMFDSGLSPKMRPGLMVKEKMVVSYRDKMWIPVEATMLNNLFVEAWEQAASDYHYYAFGDQIDHIDLAEAGEVYPPGSFMDMGRPPTMPSDQRLQGVYQQEVSALNRLTSGTLQSMLNTLESNPRDYAMANDLAIAYGQSGRYEEGVQVIQRAIDAGGDHAALHNNLGNLMYLKGANANTAFENYNRAIEGDPDDKTILVNCAIVSFVFGDSAQASELLAEAARGLPKGAMYDSLGILQAGDLGRQDEAKVLPLRELLAMLSKAEAEVPSSEEIQQIDGGVSGTESEDLTLTSPGKDEQEAKVRPHVPAGLRSQSRAEAVSAVLYWKSYR
jgi:Flp pilus assembly protein TadD